MANRVLPVALALAFALVGCQGDGDEPYLARADALRAQDEAGLRLHWLGDSFERLPLTRAEQGTLIYGECNGEGSGDTFLCTGPQVQLQHWPLSRRHPRMFELEPSAGCGRGRVANRLVAAFTTSGGLEVYVGNIVVVIFAEAERTLRAERALRPLTGTSPDDIPRSVPAALTRCGLRLDDALTPG